MSTPRRRQPSSAPPPDAVVVGPTIRAVRLERKLTATALAAAAGIHKGHLSHIEAGAGCSTATLVRLARALGMTPGQLVDRSLNAAA